MQEMNLLLVNYMETTAPGGINTVVREVGGALAHRGHKITVLQPNPHHRPREEMCKGFRIQRVDAPLGDLLYGFDVRLRGDLPALYRTITPEVVHVHGFHSLFSAQAIYLVRKMDPDVPLVFSYHLDVYRERFLARRLWNAYKLVGKKMVGALTHVIAFSQFEAETIAREFHVPRERISVVPHGVPVIDTHKTRAQGAGPRLLYAGHLLKRKNVQSIVESLDVLVHSEGVDAASLTIVGMGPERASISRSIRERGLEAHVTMKPFLTSEGLAREMKRADLLLLPSNSEAYGIVVAEALALGTPCVVADATALHEFIAEPGCFGVDYPPDAEKVARLIMEVYESKVQVGPFTDKIRTWEAVGRAYERVYCRCAKGVG
ncbi:MAG: glycosyltransferase family 4 protein [Halobacteriota archaeon]